MKELRAEIFAIINYCGIYFCAGSTKKMYFTELIFAIDAYYGKNAEFIFAIPMF